jgi:peptide/nickel transport system permease protein
MALSLLKHVLRSLAVLFIVSLATFCLMYGNGEGIARGVLGFNATDSDVQAKMKELGLDQPLLTQYWDWLRGALTGDLGRSFYTGQSVNEALSTRVPVTLTLVFLTLALAVVVSVILGVAAARYGGWLDRVVQFVSVLGGAIPGYLVAIALVFAFAIAIPLFPATTYVPLSESPSGWLNSVTLPVTALLIASVANAAAQFRGAVRDTLSQDFVRTLRARGIPESRIMFRHVLRSAAGPGLIVLNLQVIALFGGAIFIEQVFALAGMGQLATESVQLGDVPIVMGAVIVTTVVILAMNFLADFIAAVLNPKARIR